MAAGSASAPAAPAAVAGEPAAARAPIAVVELFTSEGCSSCPPADRNLSRLAHENRAGVYALSFHVDYWNDLGWRDPYSSRAFSERQRRYSQKLLTHRVYTPQLVVNGSVEMVGSDTSASRAAIDQALSSPAAVGLSIDLSAPADGKLIVSWHATRADGLVLAVAVVQSQEGTTVTRGENAGRTLSHVNVVHAFATRDINDRDGSLSVRLGTELEPARAWVVAYLQRKSDLHVVGATGRPLGG